MPAASLLLKIDIAADLPTFHSRNDRSEIQSRACKNEESNDGSSAFRRGVTMGLKYRPLRPRRPPRSSRAVVRVQHPWRGWVIGALFFLLIGGVACMGAYELGRRSMGPLAQNPDLLAANARLRQQLDEVLAERSRLRASVDTAAAEVSMARAAQDSLGQQVKLAEAEIAQLKEDLGFFESLLPASGDTSGIHVRSFRVSQSVPHARLVHYRLLVMQGGSKAFVEQPEFKGELQFAISAIRGGKPLTLTLSQSGDRPLPAVRLTHYQRIEGDLALPPDVEVRAVLVRIMQGGQTRASQSATP